MIFYITFLRCLAAILITNSRYTDIYPSDLIANGGLLGDVLFFAVSGFCLYNVHDSFFRWYYKRIVRIYPATWIATGVYCLLGFYAISPTLSNVVWWFAYPTCYHFVGSIIALYIVFYFIMILPWKWKKIEKIPFFMALVGLIFAALYFTIYDRSYYHIDVVREPTIRFLYFESMLLGAYFRQRDEYFRKRTGGNVFVISALLVVFATYFATKLLLVRGTIASEYQFVNQLVLFVLLSLCFYLFSSWNRFLEHMPVGARRVVNFISAHTLEIYLVQYVLIDLARRCGVFPLNWGVATVSILLAAFVLHWIASRIGNLLSPKKKIC